MSVTASGGLLTFPSCPISSLADRGVAGVTVSSASSLLEISTALCYPRGGVRIPSSVSRGPAVIRFQPFLLPYFCSSHTKTLTLPNTPCVFALDNPPLPARTTLINPLIPVPHSCQGEPFLADPAVTPHPQDFTPHCQLTKICTMAPERPLCHMSLPTSCLPPLLVLTLLRLHWLACSP